MAGAAPVMLRSMWSDGLISWYALHGRHRLPWRLTRDPWAVLVSEVMLQQTSVARVEPRWHRFLSRWPHPEACAAEPLEEVLREWDGLGYPRRARALWETAGVVGAGGWPGDEAGLRRLPGIGVYTARALLILAVGDPGVPPPRDVNLGRVAARAALGLEPHEAVGGRLDDALASGRDLETPVRDYTLALFDVGATLCRARRPRCAECPLSACASRDRVGEPRIGTPPRRQAAYPGSHRQLRGAVLRALLDRHPPESVEELMRRVERVPAAARPGAVVEALAGLVDDGLAPPRWRPVTP